MMMIAVVSCEIYHDYDDDDDPDSDSDSDSNDHDDVSELEAQLWPESWSQKSEI